jgi:hypothetical protein
MSGYYFKLGNNCFLPHSFQLAFYKTFHISLCGVVVNYLTVNGQNGTMLSHYMYIFFVWSEKKNAVPQWIFKMHSAPAAAENCHLKAFVH